MSQVSVRRSSFRCVCLTLHGYAFRTAVVGALDTPVALILLSSLPTRFSYHWSTVVSLIIRTRIFGPVVLRCGLLFALKFSEENLNIVSTSTTTAGTHRGYSPAGTQASAAFVAFLTGIIGPRMR